MTPPFGACAPAYFGQTAEGELLATSVTGGRDPGYGSQHVQYARYLP